MKLIGTNAPMGAARVRELGPVQPLSRRLFIAGMGFVALSACTHGGTDQRAASDRLRSEKPFFRSHNLPIGIQVYSLGADAYRDIDATFGAIAEMGYKTIELPGLIGRSGADIRRALDRAGLACPSVHLLLQGQLDGDIAQLSDELAAIGASYAISPRPFLPERVGNGPEKGQNPVDWFRHALKQMTPDDWKRNADLLNARGKVLKTSGIRIGYHNHNAELRPFPSQDGMSALDILLRLTDPEFVTFEMDVGWIVAAGADPLAMLRSHSGRFDLIHVKDVRESTVPNFDLHMNPAELGEGTVNWRELLPAALDAGVQQFFVEQEPPFTIPRFTAAAKNFLYLDSLNQ